MSEYWKSTPSYWCKFCSTYVRDTTIERRNHESTIKHQNNIQRNLRQIQKTGEREERDKKRAKDEVARLNRLVGGTSAAGSRLPNATASISTQAPSGPKLSAAQQRKLHAEQLAALGVELPEELKRELSGVGGWSVVSERVIEPKGNPEGRSLADIKREADDNKEDVKVEPDALAQGVHKRKLDDEENSEEDRPRRKAWGSKLKSYPGAQGEDNDADLDALLSGMSQRKDPEVKIEAAEDVTDVKKEGQAEDVKKEDGEEESSIAKIPSAVVFKKRKGRK